MPFGLWTKKKKIDQVYEAQKQADLNYVISQLEHGNLRPLLGYEPNLSANNEVILFKLNNVSLEEARAQHRAQYVTVRMRIVSGLWVNPGQMQSESVDRLAEIDRGTLVITNKRLFLDGIKKSTIINLSQILTFRGFATGIVITKIGKEKKMYFKGLDQTIVPIRVQNRSYDQPLSGNVIELVIDHLMRLQATKDRAIDDE